MKKFLFVGMLALSAAAWATDPVAVWDGASSDYNFLNPTNGSFSITVTNDNTIATDGSYIQMAGTTGGVTFCGSNGALNYCTIIIRGSGLNLATNANQHILSLLRNLSATDSVGICLYTNNAWVAGIDENAYYAASGVTTNAFTSGETIVYKHNKNADNGGTGGTFAWEIVTNETTGALSLETRFSGTSLKYNGNNYKGVTLGGRNSSSASATIDPATGWKVEKIAIFGDDLSESEILSYAFPSEAQTLDVTTDTTVSAINELTTDGVLKLTLNVTSGVTITNDATFKATIVSVTSTGDVAFATSDNSVPSDVAKLDVSDVTGKVTRSWYSDPGIIGMNFNTNGVRNGTSYGTTDDTSGALASGGVWYGSGSDVSGTIAISDDGLTQLSWSCANLYTTASSGLSTFMQGYLDDGSNQAQVYVTGIPYDAYDVIIYCATDNSEKTFKAKVVNGTSYIWDDETSAAVSSTNGVAITETDTWGSASVAVGAAVLGSNAIRVGGLTGALSIIGGSNGNSARGCIAAIQIMPQGEGQSWALSLADGATATWTSSTWTGATATQSYPTNEAVTISLSGDATLTVDAIVDLPQITLTGSGTLTLVEGDGATLTADRIISAGPSISATSLTVTETLTAALVIPSDGLTITVPEDCSVTQSGAISGTGALTKDGAGTLTVSTANTFTGGLVVNAGSMKTTASTGYGPYTSGAALASLSKITVNSGATLDLSGTSGYCYDITSAGGTIVNTGTAMGTSARQMTRLTLSANSTVGGSSTFGLLGSNYAATYLNLAGYTLTKTNSNDFLLYNTTVAGDSGTIQVDEGTVTLYGTCAFSGTTVSLGADGTLVYGTASVTGMSVAGSGTVKLGTYRPSDAITFADGNSVTLALTLSSNTSTDAIEIPYSGAAPSNVVVYLADGSTVDTTATYTTTDSKITVTVTVAESLAYTNPVTGEETTFTYVFRDTAGDQQWTNTQNWYTVANNRYVAHTSSYAPAMSSSNLWDPCVFSNKTVTSSATLEGWNMKFGLYDNSSVTIGAGKIQCTVYNQLWFMVDETSKLTISSIGSNTSAGTIPLYIAAKDGLEFSQDFTKGDVTFQYNLKGDGSVNYVGSAAGTHVISNLVLNAYTTQQDPELTFGLVKKHPLVTFGTSSSPTITTSGAAVYFGNSYSEDNLMSSETYAATAELTLSDAASKSNAGKYYIYSDETGIYIDYIGYAEGALAPGIRVYVR